ncbi:hypothetical protein Tco_1086534 [Tanacetum coccineum]
MATCHHLSGATWRKHCSPTVGQPPPDHRSTVVNDGSQRWSTAVNTAGPPVNGGGQRRSTVVDVCHEKVVRISLEGDGILRVHGERTQGVVKTLMNIKSKEEHEVHLKLVLESLRKEKLYAKFSKLGDALSRKERVKSRRVRGMILAAQSEAFKQENVLLVGSVMDEAHASRDTCTSGSGLRTYYNLGACLVPRVEKGYSYLCYAIADLFKKSPVLWAEIGESSLTGLELVQETTDKFEVGDRVLLRVSPWKGVVRFGKKGKLAPRYVGPFEILKRIGPVAYRLRLPEELSSVHDTFHVSNLKKCLADANLHVPLNEIKIDGNGYLRKGQK